MWPALIGAGAGLLSGWLDNNNQNNNPNTSTTTTSGGVSPQDEDYINRMRGQAGDYAQTALGHPGQFMLGPDGRSVQEQADPFMNPFQDQVIGGLNQQYDRQRGQAQNQVNAAATGSGAFGGSRHALASGARLGEIDRAQGQQVGNLLHGGWQNAVNQGLQYSEYQRNLRERQAQEPLWRHQQAQGALQGGYGQNIGTHSTSTTTGNNGGGNPWATGIGTGLSVFGALGGGGGGGGGGGAGQQAMQPPTMTLPNPTWQWA